MTVAEALAAWDNGEPIPAIEMGGMGPGYEQAIQVLIVELLRGHVGSALPTDETQRCEWGNVTARRIDDQCGGFSGAQVGAARSVAYRMLRDGFQETIENMRSHDYSRVMYCSNFWPIAKGKQS